MLAHQDAAERKRKEREDADRRARDAELRRASEFRAQSPPASTRPVETWFMLQERLETEREQRTAARSAAQLTNAHLPPRMHDHALKEAKRGAMAAAGVAPEDIDDALNPTGALLKARAPQHAGAPGALEDRAAAARGEFPQRPKAREPEEVRRELEERVGDEAEALSLSLQVRRELEERHATWERRMTAAKQRSRATKTTTPHDPLEARRATQEAKARVRASQRALKERREADEAAADKAARREAAARGARVPENPRMTYSAYLKALKIRETLERERKAAAKDGKSDEKRRESARRAGAKVKAATVDFDAERERAADERKASRQEFVESFRSGAKMRENQAKIRQAASRQPSLIERLSHESARERAKAAALKRVAHAVYGADGGARGEGDDWRKAAVDAEIFDEAERAQLGIALDDDDDYGLE